MKKNQSRRKKPVRKAARKRSSVTAASTSSTRRTHGGTMIDVRKPIGQLIPVSAETMLRIVKMQKHSADAFNEHRRGEFTKLCDMYSPKRRSPWKSILYFVIGAAFAAIIIWAFATGLKEQDRADCLNWQQEALNSRPYSYANPGGFYITWDQYDQCESFGLDIAAPIR